MSSGVSVVIRLAVVAGVLTVVGGTGDDVGSWTGSGGRFAAVDATGAAFFEPEQVASVHTMSMRIASGRIGIPIANAFDVHSVVKVVSHYIAPPQQSQSHDVVQREGSLMAPLYSA